MSRKKRTIAISQPYYFPWLGACEIYCNADVYVFLDDVNFQSRGFNNRVRCRTRGGSEWMTVALKSASQNKKINAIEIQDFVRTHAEHIKFFRDNYEDAEFFSTAMNVIEAAYAKPAKMLSELAINSEMALFSNFTCNATPEIYRSSRLNRKESGSDGILEIVQMLEGDVYLTAHGAINYLDHDKFEQSGIEVRYMNYGKWKYNQLFEKFDPFVSALDALANLGPKAKGLITHETLEWRSFLKLHAVNRT